MLPLTFAGAGWALTNLGMAGPLGVHVGIVGVAVTLVGVYRIRWRNQTLTWTFWGTGGLLVSLLALFLPIPRMFVHLVVIAVLQTAVAVSLATGVRECLVGGRAAPSMQRGAHLPILRSIILVLFGATLAAVTVDALVLAVPQGIFLLLSLAALAAHLWLAGILLRVRDAPSVQGHSTR